jgi:hypothetical protein
MAKLLWVGLPKDSKAYYLGAWGSGLGNSFQN